MLITPESSGTIPEKEQIALKNVRQEILIGEQKVRQLRDAERQVNSEIKTALQSKSEVIQAIETLEVQRRKIELDIKPLIDEVSELAVERGDLLTDISKLTEEKSQLEADIASQRKDIKSELESLSLQKENHVHAVARLADDKRKHDERVERLIKAFE